MSEDNWFKCPTCLRDRCKGIVGGQGPVCSECRLLKASNPMTWARHSFMVRCPKCEHLQEAVPDCDFGEMYEEGEHTVTCDGCGLDYEISTHVTYSFESPPLAGDE